MSYRARINITSGLFAAAAFIAPTLALFSGLAITPLLAVVLSVAIAEGLRKKFVQFPTHPITFAIILFAAWAFASCFWAIDPQGALEDWSKTFTLLLLALIAWPVFRHLSAKQMEVMGIAMWAGLALTLVFIGVELASNGAMYGWLRTSLFGKPEELFNPEVYNRGACFLAVIFWPWLLHAMQGSRTPGRLIIIGITWLLVLAGVSGLESLSAKLAFIGGTLIYMFVWVMPRFSSRLMALAIISSAIAIPLLSGKIDPMERLNDGLAPSATHRLIIWDFAHSKAIEKPVMGWGFGSAKVMPGGHNHVTLPNQSAPGDWTYMPRHPHNAVMQIWLELGIPGLVLYAAMLLMALVWVGTTARTNSAKAALLACLGTYYGISLTAFSVWQEWWVVTALFAALLLQCFMHEFRDSAGHKLIYKTRL